MVRGMAKRNTRNQRERECLRVGWYALAKESSMKTKFAINFVAASCLAISPGVFANPSPNQDKSAEVRSITGCLSKGDSADEFAITASNGSTWELKSDTVKLSSHVGHTVTVTGKVWHPDMHGAKEKAKDAVDADAKEHGHLNVTKMSMVSESCK
jgi:hypothetical protein